MRYIILAVLLSGCSCQSISQKQNVVQYQNQTVTVKQQLCKGYAIFKRCESMINEQKSVQETGQNMEVSK